MNESKQADAVDLRDAAAIMDRVRAYAAEAFGFSPWKVKPVAVSKEGPEESCRFEVCGVPYSSDGGTLRIDALRGEL